MNKSFTSEGVAAPIFLLLLLSLLCTCASANTIIVDINGGGDTTSIKTAIGVAESRDTILVRSGTYDESFEITQDSITLQGDDKSTTIIKGDIGADEIDDLTITGFTFQDGVVELTTNNLRISDNIFKEAKLSVSGDRCIIASNTFLSGSASVFGNNNKIAHNKFEKTQGPAVIGGDIWRHGSFIKGSDCIVSDNTFSEHPLTIKDGSRNTIEKSTFAGTGAGVSLNTVEECEFTDNIISNTVIGIDLKGESRNCRITGNIVEGGGIGSCITLLVSSFTVMPNNYISENTISDCSRGIWILSGERLNVNHNTITNCDVGIEIDEGEDDIIITCNTFSLNDLGVAVGKGSMNIEIYKNNFLNNEQNAVAGSADTLWDNGKEGNYWSDYTGSDADGDGIGDKPYINIGEGCKDNYPIMQMNSAWGSGISIPTPTPIPTAASTPTKTPISTRSKKTTPAPLTEEKEIPGFEVVLTIAGLLAVAYLLRKRK